jgi:two-component system nitrate/nitrite sensor histidine kinase NarX
MMLADRNLKIFRPLVIISFLFLCITIVVAILLSNQLPAPLEHPTFRQGIGILIFSLIGILYYFIIRKLFVPFFELKKWSDRLRSGDLNTKIPLTENTSFRGVISDVNNITHELSDLTEEMDLKVQEKTKHIAAKSRSLEILYDIATDLSTARNLDELLEQFLDTLMVLVDAKAASVRLITENDSTLLIASRGLSNEIVKQEQCVKIDRCLCGDITKNGGFGIQAGIESCNKIAGIELIKGGCAELIVVPLQYRDNILGVYNLFLKRPSSELGKDVGDLLNSIGKHLGLAIEKSRLDDNERRLAIMEERNMIGNELHDSLAQSLVSMRLQIKMLGEILFKKDIRGAQNEVRRLRSSVDQAHEDLRDLLGNFKSLIDDRGLVPAINDLVLTFKEETKISVFLQNEWNEYSFSPIQEVQIYRIIQEALANVRKHSNAANVRIILKYGQDGHYDQNNDFIILIEDDGHGIEAPEGSEVRSKPGENIGITIMKERAQRLGGTLAIESEAGDGTRIFLNFPATNKSINSTHLIRSNAGARTSY